MKTIYDGEWVNDEFTHGKVTYYKIQEGKEVEVGNYDG
jgi:predicted SpoU family rRNA methylase